MTPARCSIFRPVDQPHRLERPANLRRAACRHVQTDACIGIIAPDLKTVRVQEYAHGRSRRAFFPKFLRALSLKPKPEANSSKSEIISAKERDGTSLLIPVRLDRDLPLSSAQVRTPTTPIRLRTQASGFSRSAGRYHTFRSQFEPLSNRFPTSDRVSANAFRSFRVVDQADALIPLYRFAKWFATFARVLVGAMPMLTGMPVQRRTFTINSEQRPGRAVSSTPSMIMKASSIE